MQIASLYLIIIIPFFSIICEGDIRAKSFLFHDFLSNQNRHLSLF